MRGYTPEFLARLRHAYEKTDRPLRLMALDFKIGERTLYRIAYRAGWIRAPRDLPPSFCALEEARALLAEASSDCEKQPPTPDPSAPLAAPAGGGEKRSADSHAADRIAQLVEREIAAAETMRAQLRAGPCAPIDVERMARALSTLTQTLQTLQRLRAAEMTRTDDTDDMPRDMDKFRRDLARRIDAFVASRTGAANADRDGGGEALAPAGR